MNPSQALSGKMPVIGEERLSQVDQSSSSTTSTTLSFSSNQCNILTLQHVHDFVIASKMTDRDPLLPKIANMMIQKYNKEIYGIDAKCYDYEREMTALIDILDQNQLKTLIRNLNLEGKKPGAMSFDLIARLFRRIFLKIEQDILQDRHNNASNETEGDTALSIQGCVEILTTLAEKIAHAQNQYENDSVVIDYLEAFITLLNLMVLINAKGLKRRQRFDNQLGIYEQTKAAIKIFEEVDWKERDPLISYLAQYAREAIKTIGNDETALKAGSRRFWSAFRGFCKIAANVNITAPWQIFGAIDAYKDFKECLARSETPANWFKPWPPFYFFVKQNPSCILGLAQACNRNPAEVFEESPIHDYLFLTSFVHLLNDMLYIPDLKLEINDAILSLLNLIQSHNKPENKKPFLHYFRLKDCSEANHMYEYISNCLQNYEDFRQNNFDFNTNSLFSKSIRKVMPWHKTLQDKQQEYETDEQYVDEKNYYLPPLALNPLEPKSIAKPTTLESQINRFLLSSDRILLIEGDAGSGKSLSMLVTAAKLSSIYTFQQFFPIKESLASLSSEQNGQILTKIFNSHEHLNKFAKERKIVWIFDAYDEMLHPMHVNLYQLNDIDKQSPQSKVIFTCRSGYLADDDYRVFCPTRKSTPDLKILKDLSRVEILPFDSEKIEAYIREFLAQNEAKSSTEKNENLWKTAQKYIDYINTHPYLSKIVSNPLYLRLMVETLPKICEHPQAQSVLTANDTDQLKDQLIGAFFCSMVIREIKKQTSYSARGLPSLSKLGISKSNFRLACLEFAIKFAQAIQTVYTAKSKKLKDNKDIISNKYCLDSSDEEYINVTREFFEDLLEDSEKTEEEKTKTAILRRACPIKKEDNKWRFQHEEFYNFFLKLNDSANENLKKEFITAIQQNTYEFVW